MKYKNRWTHDDAQLAGNPINKAKSDTASIDIPELNIKPSLDPSQEQDLDLKHIPELNPVLETREVVKKVMVAQHQKLTSENETKLKRKKVGRLLKRLMEEGVITADMAKQLKRDGWRPDS